MGVYEARDLGGGDEGQGRRGPEGVSGEDAVLGLRVVGRAETGGRDGPWVAGGGLQAGGRLLVQGV